MKISRWAVATAMVVMVPATALAQSVDDVADQVEFRGYYIEPGVNVSVDAMEELVDEYPTFGFVALGESPSEGDDLFADNVLAVIDDPDTVIVLSESGYGIVSAVYGDDAIEAAADEAFFPTGDSHERDFEQVAEALSSGSTTAATAGSGAGLPTGPSGEQEQATSDSGGGFPLGTVIFLALVIGGIWWLLRRNKKRSQETLERRMETGRAEIQDQMAVIANEILEFSDRVDQDQHPEAVAHYRRASDIFHDAEDRLERSGTVAQLEELSDELDEARWEMAAADAIVEGRPVPPRPEQEKPEPCFFDPTHGAGVEEAQLQTPAGSRTVMVCKNDAERLRRGDRPEPRSIDVGGSRVPAPQAPRTHGGGGMDWLDAFSILVGGMGGAMDYRWGRPRRRGGFGGGIPSPFPRSSRSSSSSRSRSSRSSRPSRSVGRGRGSR